MAELKDIPIVHINTAATWRGGEKQTFYMAAGLQKKGYRSICICNKDSILHQRLLSSGISHYPVKMRSEFDVIAAMNIAGITRELKAGILHMHTSHAHSLGLLSNYFYRVPVNVVSRRVDYKVKDNFLNRIKYGFPDKYITVSNAIRDILIECGIPSWKAVTVYSGIDINDYLNLSTDYLEKEFNYIHGPGEKIILVNAAALTPQKDHETLIRAADILRKTYSNFILFIAGDGELRDKLFKLRKRLNLEEYIVFTGFREDVNNLIKFSDIFVISSRWEGLGTSIIDAMAMGRPVVAAKTGGIPELIEDGINGLLADKENPEDLADAVLRLIRDTALREKISSRAMKRAIDFSIEATIDRTISEYKKLLIGYLS